MTNGRATTLTLPWRFPALRAHGWPLIPIGILIVLALVAIFAEFITPYNPEIGALQDRFKPPAWVAGGSEKHLLGTDHLGRDVLSRLIFGARVSLVVGFMAGIFAGFVGPGVGIISGYLRGLVGQGVM